MKLSRLFMLLLALPLAFAACEPTPHVDETPDPVLTLTSAETLEFSAEGGQAEIAYTLANPVEGTELTATCEAEWVNAVAGDKVRVTVEANDGDAREAKIVVAYGEQSFDVAVKQAAKAAKEYLFDEEMAYAERVDLADYGFPGNYYLIGFYSADNTMLFGAVIVGPEGEDILTAGTYTSDNGGLMMEGFEFYVGETEEYFFEGGSGVAVVGGDIDGYTFDFDLADSQGQNFHFTYEGTVVNMKIGGNLPTEDVVFEATKLDGIYYGTKYSDTYNYYLNLSDLGLSEDGYAQGGGTYYQLDLYGVEGEVDAEGYIHVPAGTYVFDADDTMAEWTLGNYYSGYSKVNAEGTAYDAQSLYDGGQVVVTENNITVTVIIAGVQHTVTYNGEPKIYVGENGGGGSSENVEMEANYAYANYFGDQYTPGYADNYYLFLSDVGLDADGYEQANGTYYRFDIYAPIMDTNATKIPAGTYTVDMTDSGSLWTASLSYSAYFILDEYGWDYVTNDYPASGTIVVGEDGTIVAEVTMLMSGATHKVTFNGGNIDIYDASSSGGGDDGIYSTLLGDLNCNLSDGNLYYEYYGDWYEVGYMNWMIAIMPNDGAGDFVQFDLLAGPSSTDNFVGEYAINDSLEGFTAYPGYIDSGYMSGCWYYTEDGVTMAPFVGGSVEVSDNGDGTITVEFDVWDDLGYSVTGSWSGTPRSAAELQAVTRSSSLKELKSVSMNNAAPAKSAIVAKNPKAQSRSFAKSGLSLR